MRPKKPFLIQVSAASEKKPEGWQFPAFLKQKGSQGVRNKYFRKASIYSSDIMSNSAFSEASKAKQTFGYNKFP